MKWREPDLIEEALGCVTLLLVMLSVLTIASLCVPELRQSHAEETEPAPYIWNLDEPPLWLPGNMARDAYTVIQCESRHDPNEVGELGERGLFQIHPIHAWRFEARGGTWDSAFDPGENAAVAIDIWRERGWTPWGCRP